MKETRKKYLADLSGITSPYFTSHKPEIKSIQRTPSRFCSSNLSEIFPELSSKQNLKKVSPSRLRPYTVMSKSQSRQNILPTNISSPTAHSDNQQEFNNYMKSLTHLRGLYNNLTINYLISNSSDTSRIVETYIPRLTEDCITKETLIRIATDLTECLKDFIQSNTNGKHIEVLWRAILKILDYSFTLGDSNYLNIKDQLEKVGEDKIDKLTKIHDGVREEYVKKIGELNEQIEKHLQKIEKLEEQLEIKSKVIMQREKKIVEMNSFENKTLTIFRLKRMIKGVSDFINETEIEQVKQEKTLEGISKILDITEKLSRAHTGHSKESQTFWDENTERIVVH